MKTTKETLPLFYTGENETLIRSLIFLILSICTLGLAFWLYYDYFMVYRYARNRTLLYKYLLGLKDLKYSKDVLILNNKIIEYEFDNDTIQLWLYDKQNELTLDYKGDNNSNIIGLFAFSPIEKYKVNKIIKLLREKF